MSVWHLTRTPHIFLMDIVHVMHNDCSVDMTFETRVKVKLLKYAHTTFLMYAACADPERSKFDNGFLFLFLLS